MSYHFQYCQKIVVLSADKTKVLLCKRRGEADYDGTFSFIGGKMETTDASILAGLKREKDEEVGVDFKVALYPHFSHNALFRKSDGNAMILPHYLAFHKSGEMDLREEEYSEYQWVSLDELDIFEPKIPNIPETVRELLKLEKISLENEYVEI